MSGWARRWREVLADGGARTERRAQQGESLLRSGRVGDVRLAPGRLSGSVQGTRATPYVVVFDLPMLDDATWQRIAEAVAGQVRHSARLLAGQAPEGLESELAAAGVRLFPRAEDVEISCGCAEGVCVHAWAVWEAVAEQIEQDPFVLLLLRGRGRQRLLEEVARQRGQEERRGPERSSPDELDPAGWWDARGVLRDLPARPAPPPTPAPALRALGDPEGWAGGVSAYDLFRPLVQRGARWAAALLDAPDAP